jgi:hypothetical protein
MRRGEGRREEKGQALVFVAVSMAVLAGMVGLGLDAGQLYAAKQAEQVIADAVAQAAVMDIFRVSNIGANSFGSSQVKCPPPPAAVGTIAPCAYARQNGMVPSDKVTIDFAYQGKSYSPFATDPSCAVTDVILSGTDSPNLVCVTMQRRVSTFLISALVALGVAPPSLSTVTASAIAAVALADAPAPIVVTHPTLQDAFQVNSNATTVTICGGPPRAIQVNSDGSGANPPEAFLIKGPIDLSKAGPGSYNPTFSASGNCNDATTYGADFASNGPARAGDLDAATGWPAKLEYPAGCPVAACPHEHYVQPSTPRPDPLGDLAEPSRPPDTLQRSGPIVTVNQDQVLVNGGGGTCKTQCTDATCDIYWPGRYSNKTGNKIGLNVVSPDGRNSKGAYFYPGLYYIDSGDTNGFQVGALGSAYMLSYDCVTAMQNAYKNTTPPAPSIDSNSFGDGQTNPYGMVLFNAGSGTFGVSANGSATLVGSPASLTDTAYEGIIFWNCREPGDKIPSDPSSKCDAPASNPRTHKVGGGGTLTLKGTIYLSDFVSPTNKYVTSSAYELLQMQGGGCNSTGVNGQIVTNALYLGGNGCINMSLNGALLSHQRYVALVK